MQDMMPQDTNTTPDAGHDREGAMAKADLFKLANYSLKLFKQIQDDDQLEAWVQAKITKAADYIASVYHYLEYEMKFSEYGEKLNDAEVYSEDQKQVIVNKLMEAKMKIKELKKAQAEKVKESEDRKPAKKQEREVELPSGAKVKATKVQGWQSQKADKEADKEKKKHDKELDEAAKPDYIDLDKDGNKKETMKKAAADKKKNVKEAEDKCNHSPKGKKCPVHGLKECGVMEEGKDEGKPGKNFAKIAKKAGEKYGSKEAGERVAGAVRNKLKKAGKLEEADKADKDYDGDGKVETNKDEVWGSRAKAAAKAGKPFGKDKKVNEDPTPPGYPNAVAAKPAQKKVTVPQDVDGSTAPPNKDPKTGRYPKVTSGPNKGKEWSEKTPGPTNPAMKESVLAESAEVLRIKELTQRLLG